MTRFCADASGAGQPGWAFEPHGGGAFQLVGRLAMLDLPGHEADRLDTCKGKDRGVTGHGTASLRQILRLVMRTATALRTFLAGIAVNDLLASAMIMRTRCVVITSG
ncbi:hypothetical protein QV13_16350 [Mesorhizobium hungaricum]|jgi:hypothetical protein|uniref:Uncharacterized protein n=1 Tax=Mesorhizobium hungaricum TaxID=1566387 RepID=A0A1C2DNP9_9HYPH|nr:hypothetical protein QV13_16350 [Mesorhizobium hungaricum]